MAHPENAIEILHEYRAADLGIRFRRVAAALDDIVIDTPTPRESSVRAVNSARRDLRSVLRNLNFREAPARLRNGASGVYDLIVQGNFAAAQPQIGGLRATLPEMSRRRLDAALRSQPMRFTHIVVVEETTEIDPETGKPETQPGGEFEQQGTLAGYSGPPLSPPDRRAVLELRELLAGGPEQDFRLGLLRAECHRGLGQIEDALREYLRLLRSEGLVGDRRKHVAIRAGFGRLASGDAIFRSAPTLDADRRARATSEYEQAVALVAENGVAPDNPQRAQIEAHAELQKRRLAAGMNFLGLRAAFVPVQRFTQLRVDAEAQRAAAEASAQQVLNFLQQAEDLIGQQMDLEAQQTLEETANKIAAEQVANATLGVDKIEEQIELIDGQQDFLLPGAAAASFKAIMEGIVAGGATGLFVGAAGIAQATVNFLAQKDELEHQRAIAEIEKSMADNAEDIALLEQQMSADRLRFLEEKLAFLANKQINADLFFRLAEITERRAERQLELGIQVAYLFERALAFFLGAPDIAHIDFDYRDRHPDLIGAVGELEEDLALVVLELNNPELEKADFFEEIVSLRQLFPLQFAMFQQTGTMSFDYSLYQLSKKRPASHQCRLREVGVELSPPPPVTGFSGNLTHAGRFLVRDKAATLAPETVRLVPTADQLNQALEEQRESGSAAAAVSGILCYTLGPDVKELSLNTQFVSPAPEQFTLDIFEGYGPTGLWTLNISDHGSLAIQDVLLHFAIVSRESDTSAGGLQDRVNELIRAYERELADGDLLDRISAFSLRQQFSDAFFALEEGEAAFELERERLPEGLTNLQFKALVAQALDPDDRGVAGVALELGRPEFGFARARVTGDGGFSEDLSAIETLGIEERFPVLGGWELRLPDPSQFSQLGDLRLFFVYAFEEP